jgi:hypothetical protein
VVIYVRTFRKPKLISAAEEGVESYQNEVTDALVKIESKLRGSGWDMLELEEQGNIMYPITRLYGVDGFTSAGIRKRIDRKPIILAEADGRHHRTYRQHSYISLYTAESNTEALLKPAPFDKSGKLKSSLTSSWRSRCPPRLSRYGTPIVQAAGSLGMLQFSFLGYWSVIGRHARTENRVDSTTDFDAHGRLRTRLEGQRM